VFSGMVLALKTTAATMEMALMLKRITRSSLKSFTFGFLLTHDVHIISTFPSHERLFCKWCSVKTGSW
jgi:hypothetical protein